MWKERIFQMLARFLEKPPILTMNPSGTLDAIFDYIRRQYARPDNTRIPMIGIVFARPECKLAKDEIIPNLSYFDTRSGQNIDFFFPGYVLASDGSNTQQILHVGNEKWAFDVGLFNLARHKFEGMTTWIYSGEVDLILANVRSLGDDVGHHADFGRVLRFDLDKLVREKSIESVSKLLELLFKFAEHGHASDPVGTFSNHMGWRIGRKSLVAGLWDRLKLLLTLDLRALQDFAVTDVTR